MYNIGEMIVYGGTGVCRVEDITTLDMKGAKEGKKYYVLSPLLQDGVIYAPVDGKVFMRPVISEDEAKALIEMIPTIKAEAYHERNFNQLAAHYCEALGTHDCRGLIELTMGIYAKKKSAEDSKRKFGQVDSRFMKRAEGLLFGEMAVALNISVDEVSDYIASRVAEKQAVQDAEKN